jgi:hypothetical protein
MKTVPSRTHARKARHQARPKPAIEFPKEGERLEGPAYTLRIAAPEARLVRVAVDQGPWQDARSAVGFWWFDWTPADSGEHELIACAEYAGGREAVSETVHCLKP